MRKTKLHRPCILILLVVLCISIGLTLWIAFFELPNIHSIPASSLSSSSPGLLRFSSLLARRWRFTHTPQEVAFFDLLTRVYQPDTAGRVRLSIRPVKADADDNEDEDEDDGSPTFSLRVVGDLLEIEADSVHSACAALHYYCVHYAGCSLSWGQRTKPGLPPRLPPLAAARDTGAACRTAADGQLVVTKKRVFRHVYNLNFCTPSYTMVFWDWERWERELDWMALRGVTMPLVITGREVVMHQLLMEQGLSDEQIRGFFGGPAFLAWHRMGNLKSYAGPLPASYLRHSEKLTTQILVRARALGMTPVLPGFSGHVPDELEGKIQGAHFSRLPTWSGFPKKYSGLLFVEPDSELYLELGRRFVEIQTALFGTDHYYAVDQFNENDPRSQDAAYLAACGRAQHQALRSADPKATWLMQGWLFVFHASFWGPAQIAAYLSQVPRDGMLILDLISEATPAYSATDNYHGLPFVWSVLHNFGGQNGLRGNLDTIMQRPYQARAAEGSTMVGIGLTMEAIHQNPVIYELALDHAWHDRPRDTADWLRSWVRARYGHGLGGGGGGGGQVGQQVQQAWSLLLRSVYDVMDHQQGNGFWGVTKSVIEKRPSLQLKHVITSGFQDVRLRYNACDVPAAWRLLDGAMQLVHEPHGSMLELDVMDVGRQAMANHAMALYTRFVHALEAGSLADLSALRDQFLGLLLDLDGALSTFEYFSFEAWANGALLLPASHATRLPDDSLPAALDDAEVEAERVLYAFNARNLVTRWGPDGQISDYSSRLWGGLVAGYYHQRWKIALDAAVEHVQQQEQAEGGQREEGGALQPVPDQLFLAALDRFEVDWQRRPLSPFRPATAQQTTAALRLVFDRHHAAAAASCSEL